MCMKFIGFIIRIMDSLHRQVRINIWRFNPEIACYKIERRNSLERSTRENERENWRRKGVCFGENELGKE